MKHARGLHIVRASANLRQQGLLVALVATLPGLTHAANATWTASSNGAWDTNSNWNTGAAASGASSTATFGSVGGTGISINTAVTIGTLQFNSGAPAYSLAVNSNSSLTLGASGIVNNSSNPLTLTVNSNARVNFEGTSSAGNSILFLNSGGILDFSRSTGTITSGSIAGSTSTNIYLGSRTLTTGSRNTNTLFQGVISDGGNGGGTGGSLTKVGTGTLTLDRDNTYTGTTTISVGVLQIGNGGSTGSILGNIVNNSSLVFHRGGTSTFGGTISGSGTVTKSGGGTVTLSGSNTYSGGTLLNGGSLQVSANNNLGNASGSLTFNGGTLLYGAGFSSARNVLLNGAGTFNTSTFNPSLSGVISGSGALTKSGSGTLTLTGSNTYTGNTTVSGGTLQIGSGGTSGAIVGTVSVSNGATLAFSRSNAYTYGGNVTGSGSLNKLGSNTLTLSGANSYSGATTVNGTLVVLGAHTGSGTATINSGSTLQVGNGGTTGSFSGALSNQGSVVFNRSDNLTYSRVISGTGTLTKWGAGTLILSNNSTYTGLTTVENGTLQIGNGGTTGMIGGDVVVNSVLAFNRSDDFAFGGNISGTGSLVKEGAGSLTLTGTLSYAGTTTVLGGALFIGTGGNTGGLEGDLVINSALTFNRADDYLYGGVISGTGSLIKMGAGTLTFTGANLYTGGTTINEGALQLGNGGTTGSIVGDVTNNSVLKFNRSNSQQFAGAISGTGSVVKLGSNTLTLTGNNSYTGGTTVSAGTLAGNTQSLQGNILNNGHVFFDQASAGTYAGSISGSGSLSKQGSKLTLTGASTYTGATSLVGEVELISGASLSGTSGITLAPISGFAQATLGVSGASIATPGSLVIGDTGVAWLYLTNSGAVSSGSTVLGAAAGSYGYALLANGPSGGWTNTGELIVGASGNGMLIVEHNSVLNAGSIVLSQLAGSSGTLTIGLGASAATLNTSSVTGGAGNTGLVSFNTNDPAYTFAPVLAGNLAVEKKGSGTVTLTGANTYTGGTHILSGRLAGNTTSLRGAIVNDATLLFNQASGGVFSGSISGGGELIAQGGQLTLTGLNTYTGATRIDGAVEVSGGTVNGTSNIVLGSTSLASGALSLNNPLSTVRTTGSVTVGGAGAGALSITSSSLLTSADGTLGAGAGSSGTATVSGAGSMWSNSGALTIGSGGTGALTVSSGGVVSASHLTLGTGVGSSGVVNFGSGGASGVINTASITGGPGGDSIVNFDHTDSAFLLGSQLAGNLSLNHIGPGTTILTADNTYTGLTTISGGTLQIGNGGVTGNLTGDVVNNGTLLFNRSDDFIFGGAISGTGSLIKDGAGTLTLTGAVTYTGTTTVLAGALLIGTGGNSGSWDGDLNISTSLTFNRSDDLTYGHVVSGTGSVVKLGTGTLTYTNANTYTGGTTISVGTLQVGNGGTTGSLVGNITNNANLAFNRVDDVTFGGLISGSGTLTKLGAGTLTLTGANTYSGGTLITAGTLQVGDGGTSGGLTGNVSNAGALVFNRAGSLTYSSGISGSGTVSKKGTGTLTLTGSNTYTGATSVEGTMRVVSGGSIDGTSGVAVAPGASQTGVLHVSGTGSRVVTAGTIVVGGLGAGALTIDDGGSVSASSILLGAESGSHGVLNIGSGAAAGFLNAETVVDGAGVGSAVNLNFVDSTYTLGSNLLRTLSVRQNGSGTTVLTGVNSYTGGTYLNAGTLRVTSNSALGGAASALHFNGGTLQWGATVTNLPRAILLNAGGGTIDTGSFNVTSTGVVSGVGTLTKTGSGALSLTGANTYTGNLVVSEGTLRGTTTSLRNDILNQGAVEFLQTASGTYAGVMSGSGSLTKRNAGNLTLTGANTYTGATSVTAGTLTINGSLTSAVGVAEGGILAGTGAIHGSVSVMGVLSPGNAASTPFGTLTVNGNLQFAPGSSLRVQTDELGQNGKVNVTGALTLNGGTVEVLTGGGEYNPHTDYTIVSASGGIAGAFDDVVADFAFLTPSLSYDGNNVYLALDRNDLTFGAFAVEARGSQGAVAVAEYLDEVSGGKDTDELLRRLEMLDAAQASDTFEDLSGNRLLEVSRVSMAGTARLFEMLATRLGTKEGGAGTGLAFSTLTTHGPRAFASSETANAGSGLWIRQLASDAGGFDRSNNAAGMHTALGFDAAVSSRTVLGLSAVYTRDYVELDAGRAGASQVRTPRFTAYLSHSAGDVDLRGIVGCGLHRYDTQRAIDTGLSASIASARHSGRECSAYAQAEFASTFGSVSLRPVAGILYSRLSESAYVETGGAAALAVAARETESLLSNLGLRYAKASSNERLSFEARAIWSHELGTVAPSLRASLADAEGSNPFVVQGAARSRDRLVLGAGIATELREGFSFHGDYNLQIDGTQEVSHALVAGFRYVH